MAINASEFAQFPPHDVANAAAIGGGSDRASTTPAVRRKVRSGLAAVLAIAPNTNAAAVVRMAVSIIGKAQPNGVKPWSGRSNATATLRTITTAPTEHSTASGATQPSLVTSIAGRESARLTIFGLTTA
jgi:hypothetical protein